MQIDLRQAIFRRVHDKSADDLYEVIQDSIHGQELVLPGLGVLFEIIWEHSTREVQQQLVQTLHAQLQLKK